MMGAVGVMVLALPYMMVRSLLAFRKQLSQLTTNRVRRTEKPGPRTVEGSATEPSACGQGAEQYYVWGLQWVSFTGASIHTPEDANPRNPNSITSMFAEGSGDGASSSATATAPGKNRGKKRR